MFPPLPGTKREASAPPPSPPTGMHDIEPDVVASRAAFNRAAHWCQLTLPSRRERSRRNLSTSSGVYYLFFFSPPAERPASSSVTQWERFSPLSLAISLFLFRSKPPKTAALLFEIKGFRVLVEGIALCPPPLAVLVPDHPNTPTPPFTLLCSPLNARLLNLTVCTTVKPS